MDHETFTHWNQGDVFELSASTIHQSEPLLPATGHVCWGENVGRVWTPLSSSLFSLLPDISIIICTTKWNTMNASVEKLSKSARNPHLCNLSCVVPLYFLSFQMYPGFNGKRKGILAEINSTNLMWIHKVSMGISTSDDFKNDPSSSSTRCCPCNLFSRWGVKATIQLQVPFLSVCLPPCPPGWPTS